MATEPTHPLVSVNTQREVGSEHADIKALMAKLCEAMLLQANAPKFDPLTVAQVRSVAHLAAFLALKFVREHQPAPSTELPEAVKGAYQAIHDVAFEMSVPFDKDEPLKAIYRMRDELRGVQSQLGVERSTSMALRAQVNQLIATGRSLEEKVGKMRDENENLSIERAGLQARLRAQEDPSDDKVLNEAATRFLAIFSAKGTWPGTIQDRVGAAFRDVLGILREAAMAKPEVTMDVANRVLNTYVKHLDATRTTQPSVLSLHAALCEVFNGEKTETSERIPDAPHPPISRSAQIGGVQVTADGSYRWWWSEMCAVNVRAQTAMDFQGIPSWALRQIADHMDSVAKPAAPVEPSPSSKPESISDDAIEMVLLGALVRAKNHAGTPRWLEEQAVSSEVPLHRVAAAINRMLFRGDIVGGGGLYTLAGEKLAAAKAMTEALASSPAAIAQGERNDRVLAQRTRILAAADNVPRGFHDLWRRAGSPKYDDSYAFDIALGQLEGEGKLKVEDINGSKGYRLP